MLNYREILTSLTNIYKILRRNKKIIHYFIISILITFIIVSNVIIQINTPITYSGGCTEEEFEAVNFIIDKIEPQSFIFTDLRLSSVLRSQTDLNVITAPGSASSSYFEINTTYNAFYSNDSFKAYYGIKSLLNKIYPFKKINHFFVLFSKLYVIEGFSTIDFIFGPISIESYEKYLNSSFFEVIFQNDQCFITKSS